MRIITGKLKGRRISIPKQVDTRPTSDRTKEGMFSIIDARRYFTGITVLDLFSGSGNLAFEAISRGARKAVCIEQNKTCCLFIEKSAITLGIDAQVQIFQADVWQYLAAISNPYDLVFADPPYDYEFMTQLPDVVLTKGWLKEDGWFILEHDARHDFSEHSHCVFSKPYGRTIVTIFLNTPILEEE